MDEIPPHTQLTTCLTASLHRQRVRLAHMIRCNYANHQGLILHQRFPKLCSKAEIWESSANAEWVDLYVLISGLGPRAYSITNRYTLSYVLEVDLDSPERKASRLKHTADVVMSYLCDLANSA